MKLIYTFNGYQDVIIKDLTLNIGQRRLNDKRWFMYHYPISWEWGLVKLVISSILLKFKNYSKSIHTHTHTLKFNLKIEIWGWGVGKVEIIQRYFLFSILQVLLSSYLLYFPSNSSYWNSIKLLNSPKMNQLILHVLSICIYSIIVFFAGGIFHQSHIYRLTFKKRMLMEDRKFRFWKLQSIFLKILLGKEKGVK